MVHEKFTVEDAFKRLLLPATLRALERGSKHYKDTWKTHINLNASTMENVYHVYQHHAQTRIMQAFERLDYEDVDGFVDLMGSAVGYLANCCLKAELLSRKQESVFNFKE